MSWLAILPTMPPLALGEDSILADLLETSAAVFQHHTAIIQKAFHEAYLKEFDEELAKQAVRPDIRQMDLSVELRLQPMKRALDGLKQEMIQEQRLLWEHRNAMIQRFILGKLAGESVGQLMRAILEG